MTDESKKIALTSPALSATRSLNVPARIDSVDKISVPTPKPYIRKLGKSTRNYDMLVKVLLIGDASVGKSQILLRFSDETYTPSYISTIGIDFKIATIEIDGKIIKLQIWDTAGQERFRTITTAYYRGAMGILLVYDVTDERSFQNILAWNANVELHAAEGINKMLIGNNSDQVESRVVSSERGQALAYELGVPFLEVSSKLNINIDQAFHSLSADIMKRLNAERQSQQAQNEDNQTQQSIKQGWWKTSKWPWK
ncbi:ras family-domain-containing protein [Dactylonectria macrodidyma]|uniref:Ras family-domain-containing protein n=1 Tax=Dactylonectria macrodidyma TaxID=307937 RepID=A0A9P9E1H0_9HYPO|nr:ras family-domain-containing protein [Dactylonectria macrodidyma]